VGVPGAGLSLEADGGGRGDAAELFLERAAAAGSRFTSDDWDASPQSVAGSTAWRWQSSWPPRAVPSLGLDGIEAGLADRLQLLTGGQRIDARHRSLRSTLDWSYALLDEPDQAIPAPGLGVRGTVHGGRGGRRAR
jgi:predicted ATPase